MQRCRAGFIFGRYLAAAHTVVYNTVCTRKYGIQMLYNCIGNFVQPIDLANIAKEKKKIKKEFCLL